MLAASQAAHRHDKVLFTVRDWNSDHRPFLLPQPRMILLFTQFRSHSFQGTEVKLNDRAVEVFDMSDGVVIERMVTILLVDFKLSYRQGNCVLACRYRFGTISSFRVLVVLSIRSGKSRAVKE